MTISELPVNQIIQGDTLEVLKQLPDECVDTIITSPPYWGLRDYGIEGQIGLEPTLEEYLEKLLAITAELKRILKKTGVMFWNHGDNYSGGQGIANWDQGKAVGRGQKRLHEMAKSHKKPMGYKHNLPQKCMVLQNYRLIMRMVDEQGWILRNIIIWHKVNAMPSSVRDRFSNAYEPVFMLTKSSRYYFDLDAVRVPHKRPELNGRKGQIGRVVGGNELQSGFANKKGGWADYWKGVREYTPLGKNPGDVWTIPTQPFPEAHFATFSPKLIEPMIKAACPEEICRKCGEARVRIIEPTPEYAKALGKSWHSHTNDMTLGQHKEGGQEVRLTASYITIGWTDCGCNAGWESGIVLDPFMGSGTTALVALKLGRRFIGIELNPEYVEMAYKRIETYLNQSRLNEFVEVEA